MYYRYAFSEAKKSTTYGAIWDRVSPVKSAIERLSKKHPEATLSIQYSESGEWDGIWYPYDESLTISLVANEKQIAEISEFVEEYSKFGWDVKLFSVLSDALLHESTFLVVLADENSFANELQKHQVQTNIVVISSDPFVPLPEGAALMPGTKHMFQLADRLAHDIRISMEITEIEERMEKIRRIFSI